MNSTTTAINLSEKTTTKISSKIINEPSIGIMATTSSSISGTSVTNSPSSSSREASLSPLLNLLAPRARRYSASFASLGVGNGSGPRLTPRVSQLRQEECVDMNSREINHEREIHNVLQISQSWEDLTIVAENWSCKSDDLSNPLQVSLPSGISSCSSPSPTNRGTLRLPYGLSPSPTRRTFATRRSMSPIAMRPSQLGPVKRKFFELEENSNWSTCSPAPFKKILTESRGPSPICQSPSSVCPSPDSGIYEDRITPKLFLSKLCSNMNTNTNSSSSLCSSPSMVPSPSMDVGIDLQSNISSSPSLANTVSSSSSSSSSSHEGMSIRSILENNRKKGLKSENMDEDFQELSTSSESVSKEQETQNNDIKMKIFENDDNDKHTDNDTTAVLSKSSSLSSSSSFEYSNDQNEFQKNQIYDNEKKKQLEKNNLTDTKSNFSSINSNNGDKLNEYNNSITNNIINVNSLKKGNIPQDYHIEYQQGIIEPQNLEVNKINLT